MDQERERIQDDLRGLQQRGDEPGSPLEPSDFEAARNEFLDAYWTWHQNPDPASRTALDEAVERLRAIDPTFEFQLPEN